MSLGTFADDYAARPHPALDLFRLAELAHTQPAEQAGPTAEPTDPPDPDPADGAA